MIFGWNENEKHYRYLFPPKNKTKKAAEKWFDFPDTTMEL